MNAKVSIIIPFYNCPYINKAIDSALHQTYPNIEIIVVNDGSTKHQLNLHRLRKIKSFRYIEKGNGGTASALNMGIRNATGEYVAWLSSDDVLNKRKVEKQVMFMMQRKFHVSHTNFSIINKHGLTTHPKAGISYTNRRLFVRNLLKSCFINGSTVMFKKDIFHHVGYFDEQIRYAHDYDLWLRIASHYPFGYIDQPLTKYRVHRQMGSLKNTQAQITEAQLIRMKYEPLLKNI
ncbi:glycosyltransferase [Aliibacillus thermotolerans]|uniref:Glycosyltransferase n=1 Tax=Aliibacillus thermotolerans TaxID=1834418 RepID=A0ABW0U5J9_9BACI|nr:glycosyltransferase [Aliibacillus thermotolerans]MDA3128683.1 glycosyltransferase [Aliibacillus thermotolerans]